MLVAFVDNYREERRMWNSTDDGLEEYVFSRDIQRNSVLCLLVLRNILRILGYIHVKINSRYRKKIISIITKCWMRNVFTTLGIIVTFELAAKLKW